MRYASIYPVLAAAVVTGSLGGCRARPDTPDVNIHIGTISTAAADAQCASSLGYAKLLCLAAGLTRTLSPELKVRMLLPYSFKNASSWSNFPPMGYRDRIGPMLSEFSVPQRGYIKAILREVSGAQPNQGLDELEQILNADDYLLAKTKEAGFSSGNFHFAFLGTPSAKGIWQIYYGGHHTALTNTYIDGRLAGASPLFRGVEPFVRFNQNGRENAPMLDEQAAFARLLTSLSPAQAAKAKLSKTFTDVIVGPQRDDDFPTIRDGLKGVDLSTAQKVLLLAAINTYVGDIDQPDADAILARYRRQLDDTYVAFTGTVSVSAENDYVRIDGPSVWIEYSMQPGRSIPGVHPHSVWRDRKTDYGGTKPTS
ncbi:DUF3500 domain-containing protein [Sphingomonas sp. OK281]|uniref:DUF3500 domain-containing protein n=1 Tax=Sphingomonas sp. OK281 TaxID=1881067 RepID=UPI0008DF9FEF|nr:DUF3500 domain-containing protein [Sphingomonas sp. OK281]RZL84882.1 MAG: DUF3500 domain-containing protein [Sphingomonas sp.]SFO45597.1 Protein of unknown function [Sphingomonas sp. OK281]